MDQKKLDKSILRHEGERLVVYDDTTGRAIKPGTTVMGKPTIGRGILICSPGGITLSESKYIYDNRIYSIVKEFDTKIPWWRDMPDMVQNVMIEMAYQMGVEGLLEFHMTLSHLKFKEFIEAADQMLKSKWATQTLKRAMELANIVRNS